MRSRHQWRGYKLYITFDTAISSISVLRLDFGPLSAAHIFGVLHFPLILQGEVLSASLALDDSEKRNWSNPPATWGMGLCELLSQPARPLFSVQKTSGVVHQTGGLKLSAG
jgi:hypothetical protein